MEKSKNVLDKFQEETCAGPEPPTRVMPTGATGRLMADPENCSYQCVGELRREHSGRTEIQTEPR